ncbi:hypothetical protein B0A54_09991 [Friedmanniomyces endolithicus]|uniref:Prokaryotic-type class I peptide chain release factors domain-containing protein n=1 Tax=Friedmanniomyces endolithicus TaxID=329885 RepID=A0A4U0UTS6_9PEZI|nr:hypothetical protein B0A54_09991 [Friedmanniomyces endolithicus]
MSIGLVRALRAPWPIYKAVRSLRAFSASPLSLDKALPPRPKILESDLVEAFLRGSGPGGQKINKTSCAVQLKHIPTGIVVKCQETRSRELNRKFARQILAEKLDVLEKGDESRSAIKGERARVKKASASKKAKRKYRKLDEEKGGIEQDGAESDEQGHGTGGTAVDDVSARSAGASPGGDDVRGPT